MSSSGTPFRGSRRSNHSPAREEINTTYRAIYGGPAGLSASSWTSRSTASPAGTPNASKNSAGPSWQTSHQASPSSGAISAPARSESLTTLNTNSVKHAKNLSSEVEGNILESASYTKRAASTSPMQGPNSGAKQLACSDNTTPSSLSLQENNATADNIATTSSIGNVEGPAIIADFNGQFNMENRIQGSNKSSENDNTDHIARAQASLAAARQQLAHPSVALSPSYSSAQERSNDSSSPSFANMTSRTTIGEQSKSGFDALVSGSHYANINEQSQSYVPSPAQSSSSPLPSGQCKDSHAASDESVVDATNRASVLVSALTAGTAYEQLYAAQTLLNALEEHGAPMQRSAHQAGGTHMLQTLIRSGNDDPELREVCAAALANICHQPDALDELTSKAEVPFAIVERCLDGIKNGLEPYADLFVVLAGSDKDAVRAACATHKAVRILADTIDPELQMESVNIAALSGLQALCEGDPVVNIRKLAWGGDLAKLVLLLQPHNKAAASTAMTLLLLALEQDSRNAESLSMPKLIETLASLVADNDVQMHLQIGAAKLLASIAALPSRKEDCTQALNDFALPRACEILYQVEYVSAEEARRIQNKNGELQAACALLVGNLSVGSPLCCHVVLFHARALRTVIAVLTGCHEFALVEAVLEATATYAAAPSISL